MFRAIRDFFNMVVTLISTIVNSLITFVKVLTQGTGTAIELVNYLPAIIVSFAITGLTISAIYLIVNRGKG